MWSGSGACARQLLPCIRLWHVYASLPQVFHVIQRQERHHESDGRYYEALRHLERLAPIGRNQERQTRRQEQDDSKLKEVRSCAFVAVGRRIELAKHCEEGRATDQEHREQ
jgi:hypothetical protein